VPVWNNSENGTSRPLIGREAWGRGPPAQPAGGMFEKYFEAPPEGLFANKKNFREEVPEAGIPPGQWAGGPPAAYYFCYILLELLCFIGIYGLQTI
jgi:hypothetical protein